MVYTVTFNPCIDYTVSVDNFKENRVNRTSSEKTTAGGKGINVSFVLHNLGVENTALGFISGFTGYEVERMVKEYGCKADFTDAKNGATRINVKMKSENETEINGRGSDISEEALNILYGKLDEIKDGDYLILAGSVQKNLGDEIYGNIMRKLSHKNIKIVVDATKALLINTLKEKPFLVKPNNHELSEIFNDVVNTEEKALLYAKKLSEMGAQNVIVSMAGDGAVMYCSDGKSFYSKAPTGTVINSVGAGDSMVAGFIAGYISTGNYKKAFLRGIAAGSASAFSSELATKEQVDFIYSTLSEDIEA